VAWLLDVLGARAGLRPAEAGEFTRRAFVNGKLDLIEVEALGDLIAAETEAQLRLARRLVDGALSRRVREWQESLASASAALEAAIDFADEEDVAIRAGGEVSGPVSVVVAEIETTLNDGGRGERLRDGVTVVIAGAPNAGKSTLL